MVMAHNASAYDNNLILREIPNNNNSNNNNNNNNKN